MARNDVPGDFLEKFGNPWPTICLAKNGIPTTMGGGGGSVKGAKQTPLEAFGSHIVELSQPPAQPTERGDQSCTEFGEVRLIALSWTANYLKLGLLTEGREGVLWVKILFASSWDQGELSHRDTGGAECASVRAKISLPWWCLQLGGACMHHAVRKMLAMIMLAFKC